MAADPPKVPALPQTAPALEPWFGSRLEGLGPFEPAPALAVAVSGGVDSLTLLALTCRWARARGGRVVALCVNHGLRAAAADEAARVQRQAEAWGAEGIILTRPDRPPATALQAEARAFRHAALEEACRARGVLHLLLAHHQDDQAETVLERLARSTGPDGLAAMASITHRPGVRLLRPFLDVPKTALVATAHALGLSWDEDPSNQDPRFERARWRALAPPLAAAGLTAKALAGVAARAGDDRARLAQAITTLLTDLIVAQGPGWIRMPRDALAAAPDPAMLARALAWAAGSLAGAAWAADPRPLARLLSALPAPGKSASLAGCLWRAEGRGHLVICREWRRSHQIVTPLLPGRPLWWDGRWRIEAEAPGLGVVALGPRAAAALSTDRTTAAPPVVARACLPGLVALPAPPGLPHLADSPEAGRSGPVVLAIPGQRLGGTGEDHGPERALAAALERVKIVSAPRLPLVPMGLRVEGAIGPPYIHP